MLLLFVKPVKFNLSPVYQIMEERGEKVARYLHGVDPLLNLGRYVWVSLQQGAVTDDRVQRVPHLMGNGGVYNLLKRLLSFYLLIEDTKSDIFEIDYESIFSIVLNLFLEDTEYELLLILCLDCCKVDVCILVPSLYCIRAFKKFSFYRLFLFFEGIEKVFVLRNFWNNVNGILSNLALVLNAHELYPIW